MSDLPTIPPARLPKGAYVPTVLVDRLLYVSGQTTDRWRGTVGADLDVGEATLAAEDAAMNVLGQVAHALGGLDRVVRAVRVHGFVACTPDFVALPAVVDGASRTIESVLAAYGADPALAGHARSAVGVAALPAGSPVEVEAIFEVRTDD
jgi:enamine deaminase RidA (YjgF/YER057c/UK114 family)